MADTKWYGLGMAPPKLYLMWSTVEPGQVLKPGDVWGHIYETMYEPNGYVVLAGVVGEDFYSIASDAVGSVDDAMAMFDEWCRGRERKGFFCQLDY